MNYPKIYLGDAVYVESDGYGFWLTTEDGVQATNRIYLEPAVCSALLRYADRIDTQEKDCEHYEGDEDGAPNEIP